MSESALMGDGWVRGKALDVVRELKGFASGDEILHCDRPGVFVLGQRMGTTSWGPIWWAAQNGENNYRLLEMNFTAWRPRGR